MAEMIEKFEIKDIHKSGAVLDPIKLDWMNGEYIKRMELGDLHEKISEYLKEYEEEFYKKTFSQMDYEFNSKIIKELQTRMKRFDEFIGLTWFFYGEARIQRNLLMNPKMKIETEEEWIKSLEFVLPILEIADYSTLDTLKEIFLARINEAGKKNWQILWPLRVALSWEEFSPGAFELVYILWKEKSIQRVKKVLGK